MDIIGKEVEKHAGAFSLLANEVSAVRRNALEIDNELKLVKAAVESVVLHVESWDDYPGVAAPPGIDVPPVRMPSQLSVDNACAHGARHMQSHESAGTRGEARAHEAWRESADTRGEARAHEAWPTRGPGGWSREEGPTSLSAGAERNPSGPPNEPWDPWRRATLHATPPYASPQDQRSEHTSRFSEKVAVMPNHV